MLWDNIHSLLYQEIIQKTEEGCDTRGFSERFQALDKTDISSMNALYDELDALEVSPSFPYHEPDGWEEICASSHVGEPDAPISLSDGERFDRIYGAWLGRCAGCALGKPFERYPYSAGNGEKRGYEWITEWVKGADAYPLSFYPPEKSKASEKGITVGCPDSCREHIRFMETDDDIRYMVLGLILGEEKGNDFTPEDVGILWQRFLPARMVFTAEACAYINSLNVELADPIERQNYIRFHHNPFREWIGAQIRIDHYAYVNAGYPHTAARVAFQDATFSHAKNGVYGAMFCAAMIAEAFKPNATVEACIDAGLAVIPKASRLHEAICAAVEMAKRASSMEQLHKELWDAFGNYHFVHTINNAACCAASLVYGNGDFEQSILCAVGCGWDTDCNGATVGSVLGALLGANALPEKWIAPLHDTMYSAIPDFHPIAISECAKRTDALWKKLHKA